MGEIKLNVLFKKIQKDDKKEILEFHVQGEELQHSDELVQLAGNIAVIEVEHSEAGQLSAEFKSIQRDSKKTVLKFNVKGDSDDQVLKLYTFAGSSVVLLMQPSQMSIEEFNDHEGMEYSINGDGTVEADPDQVTMDDVAATKDDVSFDDEDLLN